MASVVDIPVEYLSFEGKAKFLAWLGRMPAEDWVKRELLMAWARYHDFKFSESDYGEAGL